MAERKECVYVCVCECLCLYAEQECHACVISTDLPKIHAESIPSSTISSRQDAGHKF
jgi:hypothetical protein